MALIDEKTSLFLTQLRAVAKTMPHEDLCAELDIPIWQLRNWLYRDRPAPFVVRSLWPTVSRKYQNLKNRA